jgi:hypothetical protein
MGAARDDEAEVGVSGIMAISGWLESWGSWSGEVSMRFGGVEGPAEGSLTRMAGAWSSSVCGRSSCCPVTVCWLCDSLVIGTVSEGLHGAPLDAAARKERWKIVTG